MLSSAAQYPLRFTDRNLHALLTVNVGTPPQTLSLILDTSTSDFVIFNDSAICGSHCFDAGRSRSFRSGDALGIDSSAAAFGLEIDGAIVNDSAATIGADIVRLGPNSQATLVFMSVKKLQIWRGSHLDTFQTFQNADGLLGLAYAPLQRLACLNSADSSCTQFRDLTGLDLRSQSSSIFTLDLGAMPPVLGIGNISDEYESIMEWGSSNPYAKPYIHRFTVWDLMLCGANMLANYSSQWEALIDTGASCLGLPAEFFDMVMSWIPSVHCDSNPIPCSVPSNATATLPRLAFQLSANGRQLFLPLEQLLLPAHNGSSRLCVYRDIAIANSRQTPPLISFGTLAMRAFYAAFDLHDIRVGLANHLSLNLSGAEMCSAVVECRGQQRRWIAMNRCLDPDCSGYLVRHFDPVTKTCVMFFQSEIVIYVMVGVLFVAELVLHAFYWCQCRKIVATIPSY